ncbi:hypothetical protein BDR04DRAFT_1121307 [Suillus decipiens]|nr:hypothetical protein BDR04DRAFT_1121307 [Suillus decipiens]
MTNELFVTNKTLMEQLRVTQDIVESLKTDFLEFSSKFGSESKSSKKTTTKNLSNEHSKLKPIIHPLFADLCGIDSALSHRKHAELLCAIKPLENDEACREVDGNEIWHPNWMGKIDDDVNARFIKAIIDHTWDNKENLQTQGKSEIDNDNYKKDIITKCTKGYWQNIHKQVCNKSDAIKAEKAQECKDLTCQRARWQTVTKLRRQAALKYVNQTGNKEALAMIDTDFASDVLSYSESELSADTIKRRKKVDVGKTANFVRGYQWHSPHFIAFLHWHTLRNQKPDTDTEDVAGPAKESSGEPAKKCRKTVQQKKLVKKNVPFATMVAKKWHDDHLEMHFLDGALWLEGFYDHLKEDDLLKEDWDYLKELIKWHDGEGGAGSGHDADDSTSEIDTGSAVE